MLSANRTSCTPSSNTRPPFAQVTRPFISDPRINLREFRVYTALLTFPPNEAGERWPSRETLGKLTGLPPKVVSRTTSRLQELGWLAKYGDGGRSNTARYVVFDQAQPPAVILNFHLENRNPAQNIHPQTEAVAPINPPQIDPGLPPKGGQNGEGQEVDYLQAVDKREPEPARPEPAPQAQAPLSGSLRNAKTGVPDTIPEAWLEQAGIQRPDLTADTIAKSAGIFIDHHRAKGTMMADWSAAFRVWIARERVPKAAVQATQTTQSTNRYAHLDAKEQPVSAAVRIALEQGEQRRIAMLITHGIDPATGRHTAQLAPAPVPPTRPTAPITPDTIDASYQARYARLVALDEARRAAKEQAGDAG